MQETIAKGETFRFVSESLAQSIRDRNRDKSGDDRIGVYCKAVGGPVQVGHQEAQLHSAEKYPSEREFEVYPNGQAMYARAPDREITLQYRETTWGITLYSPMVARSQRQNLVGIASESITPGAAGSTFPSQAVPDGYNVLVQNQHTSDTVYVQDSDGNDAVAIEAGGSVTFGVTNFDAIAVTGTTNNPTVTATVESDL